MRGVKQHLFVYCKTIYVIGRIMHKIYYLHVHGIVCYYCVIYCSLIIRETLVPAVFAYSLYPATVHVRKGYILKSSLTLYRCIL